MSHEMFTVRENPSKLRDPFEKMSLKNYKMIQSSKLNCAIFFQEIISHDLTG